MTAVAPSTTGPGDASTGPPGDDLPGRRPRTAIASGLALASGLLLVPAYPSTGWWWLAPLGVAALAVATRGASVRFGALLGLIAGLAFFLPHLRWSGVYVGALPWFALATLESLFVAGTGALLPGVWRAHDALLVRARRRRDDRPPEAPVAGGLDPGGLDPGRFAADLTLALGVGGLWVLQEALRSRIPFGGFPWGRLAFSQADGPLVQLAWLGGAPLVGFAVATLGGALALLALLVGDVPRYPRGRRSRPAAWRAVHAAAPLLVVALMDVVVTAAHDPTPAEGTPTVRVAAVQGDVPEAGLEFNAERRAVLDNHVRGTVGLAQRVAAGEAEQPDLVLWPENSSDIDPLRNPDAAAVITSAADAIGASVLVGAVLREPEDHLSNAAIVWGPSGSVAAGPGERYVKKHPAPFAEYIPARSFFRNFSDKVDLVRTDFTAGTGSGALAIGPTTIGDVICFEVAYDGIVRDAVRDGGQLLVVQTNNATFGYTDESVQQLAMSRLRAIETGRAVVHISTVGVSAIYGPDGAELARGGHFTPEVLEATLPTLSGLTPAVRAGAWPEWSLALLGLVISLGGLLFTRRSRGDASRSPVQT